MKPKLERKKLTLRRSASVVAEVGIVCLAISSGPWQVSHPKACELLDSSQTPCARLQPVHLRMELVPLFFVGALLFALDHVAIPRIPRLLTFHLLL